MAQSANPVKSSHDGMGAVPYTGGTAFRVWAPFASAIFVVGTFSSWKELDQNKLVIEGKGYWSCDVTGAKVGDEYQFIIYNGDKRLERNDPYARSLTNSAGKSIIAQPKFEWHWPGYGTPSWNEMVIYELHVGSFKFDTEHNKRGNFDTVVSKLEYLKGLGVNVIQVLPSDEFPGDVSMGYNPSYIFAIEESYGGPNGFRNLVDKAHEKGIAVIYDVVYNHIGPGDNDLWQFDGWNQDDYGGIYFYNDWRRTTAWGDTRPDYGRGEVRQYIRDNALRWLEERGCDGLRFDSTIYIRNAHGVNNDPGSDIADGWSLLQWINQEIRSRQPWKITIAEDLQDNPWLTKTNGEGGAGFGSQWGGSFVWKIRNMMAEADDNQRNMYELRDVISQQFNGDAFQRVIYTESHDEVAATNGKQRVPTQIFPKHSDDFYALKRSTLGAAVVFTAPGIPMIFMGQEFLEWGSWSDANELDWSKEQQFAGILSLYRDLIHLRRNWFDNTRGLRGHSVNVHHVNDGDKVVAYHRWENGGPKDDVIVLLNFSNRSFDSYRVGFPRAGQWKVRFNSDYKGYSDKFNGQSSGDVEASAQNARDGMRFGGDVGVGRYTCIILSQDS